MAIGDILIGGILILGMEAIASIPLFLADERHYRFQRECTLEESRISTAKLFAFIELMNKENEELLKSISAERSI